MNLLTAAIQVHAIVDSLPRKDSWEIFYYCSTAVLALIAGFTLFAIRNQAKKTAEAAQATRDATEAIQRQADLMEGQTRATENAAKAARDNAEAARLNAQALINTERPWLVVTWASDPRTPGLFRFRCRNHGNTPAMVIALSAMPLFAQNPNLQTPPSYLAPGIPPDLNIIVHGRLPLAHGHARWTPTCHARCHSLQPPRPLRSQSFHVSPLRFGSPPWLREPTLNSPKGQRK
jgi:hypothetical protein